MKLIENACMAYALAHHIGCKPEKIFSLLVEQPNSLLPNGEPRGMHICEMVDLAYRVGGRTMLYICNHATINGQHIEHCCPFENYRRQFSGVVFTRNHAFAWDHAIKMYWCCNRGVIETPESELLCGLFDVTR